MKELFCTIPVKRKCLHFSTEFLNSRERVFSSESLRSSLSEMLWKRYFYILIPSILKISAVQFLSNMWMRFFEKNQEVILQWNCKSFMRLQPGEIIRRSLSEITIKWKLLCSFWWSNQCWTKRHEKYLLCTFSKLPAETESLPSEYARKFPTLSKDHYMLSAQRKWRKISCTLLALPMMNCVQFLRSLLQCIPEVA